MPYVTSRTGLGGGGYGNSVIFDPLNAGHVIHCSDTSGLFESWDGGRTWQYANLGLANPTDLKAAGVVFAPVTKDLCFAGTGQLGSSGAVLKGQIVANQGLRMTRWTRMAAGVGGGFCGNGTPLYLPSDGNGTDVRPRATGRIIAVDEAALPTRYVYAASLFGSAFRSTTDYITSTRLCTPASLDSAPLQGCLVAPWNVDMLLVGAYRADATNAGAWTVGATGAGTSARTAAADGATVVRLANAPPIVMEWVLAPSGNLYAACGPYGVYKVTASGATWTKINGLPGTIATNAYPGSGVVNYCGIDAATVSGVDYLAASCIGGAKNQTTLRWQNLWRCTGAQTPGTATWECMSDQPGQTDSHVWVTGEVWSMPTLKYYLGTGNSADMESVAIDPFTRANWNTTGQGGEWRSENADQAQASVLFKPATYGLGVISSQTVFIPKAGHIRVTLADKLYFDSPNKMLPGYVQHDVGAVAGSPRSYYGCGSPWGYEYVAFGDDAANTLGELWEIQGDDTTGAVWVATDLATFGGGKRVQGVGAKGTLGSPVIVAVLNLGGIVRRTQTGVGGWATVLAGGGGGKIALVDAGSHGHFPIVWDFDTVTCYLADTNLAIYRSRDSGVTWDTGASAPANSNQWWAKTGCITLLADPLVAGRLYAVFATGIWRIDNANVAGTDPAATAVRITPIA
jgi:hypothetical protein